MDYNPIAAQIFFIQQGRCACCIIRPAVAPHHLVPISLGGDDDPYNIAWLCSTCHEDAHKDLPGMRTRVRNRRNLLFKVCGETS